PRGFKVGQGAEKYRFYFNRLLTLQRSELHMAEVLANYLGHVFGITIAQEELRFEIAIDAKSRAGVELYLEKHRLAKRDENVTSGGKYIVVNISATDSVRRITREQVIGIASHLVTTSRYAVVLIASPQERRTAELLLSVLDTDRCLFFPDLGTAPLLQVASLIGGSVCVFTPDTSIIHFASALNTPVLGFFTPLQMTHEWVPYRVHHDVVYAPDGMPVSTISLSTITRRIDEFLSSLPTYT
ncbi:MAG: glycosyltransferase family 9 protein, partial [Bacteroidota bacterium]